jgi:hypothetical protein
VSTNLMSTIFAPFFFANSITLLGVLMIYPLDLVWFCHRPAAPLVTPRLARNSSGLPRHPVQMADSEW